MSTRTRASVAAGTRRQVATDETVASDRRRAQQVLLVLGRLGATVHEALVTRVDAAFVGNVEVLVITSLVLRGPLRPTEIMGLSGMTSGGVTKLIDRLEHGGLVVREYGMVPGDRRGTRVLLTPEGERVAAELADALGSRMHATREAVRELASIVDA